MAMKVLVVLPSVEVGGGQHLAIDLVGELKNKIDFKVVVLQRYQRTVISDLVKARGIECIYLDKSKGIDFKTVRKIKKVITEFKPDVVHAHLRVVPYLILPTLLLHIKKFYTVHSLANMDGRGKLSRTLLWMAFHVFGFVPVAISDTCQKSISDVYNIRIEKIPCIYNGIDINIFKPERKSTKIADNTSFIATGRFEEPKNYPFMIDAFYEFHKVRPNSTLTILGDGYMRNIIEKKIREYHLTDSVRLEGTVNNIADYLNKADIYLMTSIWEGLPLSVLEAMAVGLPIITTKAGGVIDIVQNNINGLIVDCDDLSGYVQAMIKLNDSQNMRIMFGHNSLESSKKYSISFCAEQYYELYTGE